MATIRTEQGHIVFCKEQLTPSDIYRKNYEEHKWNKNISIPGAKVEKIGHGRILITIKGNGIS